MSGPGDDYNDAPDRGATPPHPAHQHAVHHAICAQLMAGGLRPGEACSVGCSVCGVIDASPARCEQCTGPHTAADHLPGYGNMVECCCFPGTCRGGDVVDGKLANGWRCKVSSAQTECVMCGATDPQQQRQCSELHPGVCDVQHLPAEDTEGGQA